MRLENTLKKLISFPTVSDDQEANKHALTWIEQQVKGLPLFVRTHTKNGHPSLILTTRKTTSPTLWLQAHLDVVPGSPDVFRARTRGRRLYGRGAYDMKFAIAAYIELLLDLGKDLTHYDFGVMLTTDEETGGRHGVRSLLFDEGYRADVCFLPDGGENWNFEKSAKGILRIKIESIGKTGHGARPWLGHDANAQLVEYLRRLQAAFNRLRTKDPDKKPYPTLTLGILRGGEVANQIPAYAEAQLDVRFPPSFSREKIHKLLRSAKRPGEKIVVREIRHSSTYSNDVTDSYHKIMSDIITSIRRRRPGTIISHGSSDARHFRNLDIPVILIRPRGGNAHSEKEWIDLPDLTTYYRCVREFVERVALVKP